MSRKETKTSPDEEMFGASLQQPDHSPGEDCQDKTYLVPARHYKGGGGQTPGQQKNGGKKLIMFQ